MMETRVCSGQYGCGKEKSLTEEYFHFHKSWQGFDTTCKECRNKRSIECNNNNKERNNNKRIEYNKTEKGRNVQYKSQGYKINGKDFTVEDYDSLFKKQQGKCSICDNKLILKNRLTHIDHDHTTKEVRGLLCSHCNRTISIVDTIEKFRKVGEYFKFI